MRKEHILAPVLLYLYFVVVSDSACIKGNDKTDVECDRDDNAVLFGSIPA